MLAGEPDGANPILAVLTKGDRVAAGRVVAFEPAVSVAPGGTTPDVIKERA
jgi:hypothetical protein